MIFEPFPKIGRLTRGMTITEKIDGTNAQIAIERFGVEDSMMAGVAVENGALAMQSDSGDGSFLIMYAGSRSRWLNTKWKAGDNFGFARWCEEHVAELFGLGEGRHYGEWYGCGIQRGYGMSTRKFALFNTARWGAHNPNTPACCDVVPVLATGTFEGVIIADALEGLRRHGSIAVPEFMDPEGIVIYHAATHTLFKKLLKGDDQPKGQTE